MLDIRTFSARRLAVGNAIALAIGVLTPIAACSSSSGGNNNNAQDAAGSDSTSSADSASSGSTSSGSTSGSSSGSGSSGSGSSSGTGSSSGSSVADGGGDAESVASCASPGMATTGPADVHCATQADDGGVLVQSTSLASCMPDTGAPGDGGGDEGCPYGATMYGMKGDDDDCKYHVSWTSTPICETPDGGGNGVEFTVTAKKQWDGTPVTGGMYMMEAFTTTAGDAGDPNYCDNASTHLSPTTNTKMVETAAGTGVYKVNMVFDQAGQWTIRFHFHEECADVLPDSPHGHAAFFVTVP